MAPAEWGELPKYVAPPVTEIAIGLEFVPVPQLDVVRMVRLHSSWSDDYPTVVQQPPMPPSPPIRGSLIAGVNLTFGGFMPVRLWMMSQDGHRLIQLQHDRLILNWRKLGVEEQHYPSYAVLRAEFVKRWQLLGKELASTGAPLQPITAEVTFVNEIPWDRPANAISELVKALRPLDTGEHVEVARTMVEWQSEVNVPDTGPGVTTTSLVPNDANDRVSLTLVTRIGFNAGAPTEEQILASLDAAHAVGVHGFTDVTTEKMHETWGRKA